MIPEQFAPNELRRRSPERVVREQPENRLLTLEQPPSEAPEPRLLIELAERRKPHLPIETRLIRRHPGRAPPEVAGLVLELVWQPRGAIVRALDNDFGSGGGHDGKQTVAIDAPERGDEAGNWFDDCGAGHSQAQRARQRDEGNGHGDQSDRGGDPDRPARAVCP